MVRVAFAWHGDGDGCGEGDGCGGGATHSPSCDQYEPRGHWQ